MRKSEAIAGMIKIPTPNSTFVKSMLRGSFWFFLGGFLGLFFFASFLFIYYRNTYKDTVFPGITIQNVDFSAKTKQEVEDYFVNKNDTIAETTFYFTYKDAIATMSAEDLGMGYDASMLADQAYSIGRSDNFFANLHFIFLAYFQGLNLTPTYHVNDRELETALLPISKQVYKKPIDAVFTVENNKVTEFKPSKNGEEVDMPKLYQSLKDRLPSLLSEQRVQTITLQLPILITEPKISTDNVNDLGITELLAEGTSHYRGSIANRVFNLTLAANRINGTLIPPGEVFSFNKTIGDVSALTGYKQAYIISGGRTILGDGGGVCQVSTTMFRAALNAGMPIVERNQHAYRVSYYEQDSAPGIDAAIYTPNIDFKFKNDTKHHILIQTVIDEANQALTFRLYGTKDGREATIGQPVTVSTAPAPEPLYQDDPELPKDQIKQIDFAAPGAHVYFTYKVEKDGKVIIDDTFTSRYRPWQAVFLKGTKEG